MLTSVELDTQFHKLALEGKWREVLEYRGKFTLEEKIRYLWAWPSLSDLVVLKWMFEECGLQTLLSIGCGSGLLEWILNKATGVSVKGLEVDENWWISNYSPKSFIDLHFLEGSDIDLERIAGTDDFGLLFCYFNDSEAFSNYVDAFKGKWIVIIGPEDGVGRYTEPMPLRPCFKKAKSWKLETNFSLIDGDIVAIYRRV